MSGDCPTWCERHFPAAPLSHARSHWVGPISIMLIQGPDRDHPTLALGGALIQLTEAQLLGSAMVALGHEDVAAVIAELAALAGDPVLEIK